MFLRSSGLPLSAHLKLTAQFLFRVLSHPAFVRGATWTTFIDDTPSLFSLVSSQNRAQKVLAYLADLAVNGSSVAGQVGEPQLRDEIIPAPLPDPHHPEKELDTTVPCQKGWRKIILEQVCI